MSKKAETVHPEIWGILKLRGLINQKILKTVYRNFLKTVHQIFKQYQTHKSKKFVLDREYIFLSKNCLFYIFFDLKCGRTSAHIFCICLVQNCLSQVKISETVYKSVWVLKLSVLKRTDIVLFIHPCSRWLTS